MAVQTWTLFGQAPAAPAISTLGLSNITVGMQFSLSVNARLTGIWMFSPSGATLLPTQVGVFVVSTQGLAVANFGPTWSGTAGSGWVKCLFDGSFVLQSGIQYIVTMWSATANSCFAETTSFWSGGGPGSSGITNGILTAPSDAASDHGQMPTTSPQASLTYPSGTVHGVNVWIDVEVTTGIAAQQSPVPGFGLQSPRTWSTADLVTTPRLRSDMYNLAALTGGQGRPFFYGITTPNVPANATTFGNFQTEANSWNTFLTQGGQGLVTNISGTSNLYPIPLPGWWLCQGNGAQRPISGGLSTSFFSWGFVFTQGTAVTASRTDLGQCLGPSNGTFSVGIGSSSGELLLFNPASGDAIGIYAFNNVAAGCTSQQNAMFEWVGMPGTSSINGVTYTGPVGTVVASPKPASLWPSGQGGTLTAGMVPTATFANLSPTTGVRTGGSIGLGYLNGQAATPTAEVVSVTSVNGGAVGISAAAYGHSTGDPVSVPVGAAFLNEQIRDQSNFFFYPPLLRAVQGTASVQSIPNNTWTTVNLALSGSGITGTIDNFSGFASNTYTFPVSGTYLIIGTVYMTGGTANWGARLIDNNSVTYSGDFFTTAATNVLAMSVRRELRFTAGQTIALQVFQTTGGNNNTNPTITLSAGQILYTLPKLIVVFRSF